MKRIVWVAGAAAMLSACVPRVSTNPTIDTSGIPHAQVIHLMSVPFFSNTTDQCGPASLASVLNFFDKKVTPEELKAEVYLPAQRGTLPMDMLPALRKHGLSGEVIAGSFEELKNELRQGRPVIAYLNFGTEKHPLGHFLVVIGYDETRKGLYVHSGAAQDKFATYTRFDRGWKDTDHWMLVVQAKEPKLTEKDSLQPARRAPVFKTRMSAQEYFNLGEAYQKQNQLRDAGVQYQLSLKEDKHFEPAQMALGNMAFQVQNYVAAEKYYRQVLKKNPDHGAANNNLAMVYVAQAKNLDEAQRLATKALSTEYQFYAGDTLAQIQKLRESAKTKP